MRFALACCLVLPALLLGAPPSAQAGAAAAFNAHGSVEQVYATGLPARAKVSLLDRSRKAIATRRATAEGGVLFRNVSPGNGYRVRSGGTSSGPLRVLTTRSAPPNEAIYNQEIPESGYGYLTTRDGTKLAYSVRPAQDIDDVTGLPVPHAPGSGPVPVLVEYGGYAYARPSGPESGIAILANLMGFTVIDVNMRGTGCSGGAFDFFESLQGLDGYDVIETVSRQPWVLHNKVGMLGISYGGISQLFTAQYRPPHLAAITPLSVIDKTQTTLYPGGVLNTGFAVEWAKDRIEDGQPASPNTGQPWAYERIQQGDEVCKENQALHGEAANLRYKIRANDHYRPAVADPLSPITFVDKIKVPTFLACQWTDEQTGGSCPTLAEHFTGTNRKWFTFTNGTHVDSLAPEVFNRWYDFLQLYVAKQAPIARSAFIRGAAPVIYQEAMGVPGVTLPPDPIQQQPTFETALAAYEQLPQVRILFDNGAGGSEPGQPLPGFEQSFPRWPIPGTKARSWFLSPGGALADKQGLKGVDKFTWDADARPPTNFSGDTGSGGLWTATPDYKWSQNPTGSALSYVSQPLAKDTAVIGAGAVHLWMRSSAPRTDFQATISEIRPDGKEVFVQGGWVRGDLRRLDPEQSTPLAPVLGLRQADESPLPSDRFVKLTIPLYYEGHAYRKGSRIRVIISAPGGDQPVWAFAETKPKGRARVAISYSKKMPSRLTLPVVPGVDVPTEVPPCPGLRGEPCRDYKRLVNR